MSGTFVSRKMLSIASASLVARGPMITATLLRSSRSWVLVLARAGLPAVSSVISSTLRPAIMPPRFLKVKSRTLRLLLAAGGQGAGIDGEEPNFERLRRLRKCAPRWQYAECCSARQQRAARDRKFTALAWHPRTP